jgi:hypothetical protein
MFSELFAIPDPKVKKHWIQLAVRMGLSPLFRARIMQRRPFAAVSHSNYAAVVFRPELKYSKPKIYI